MSEPETLDDLIEITKSFGEVYDLSKSAVNLKDEYQRRFFEAATREMASKPLSQRVVEIPPAVDPNEWVARYYPGWYLIDGTVKQRIKGDVTRGIIQEDPAFAHYSFVNPEDGRVYSRTTQQGAAYLDVERLRRENPALMYKVTEWSPDLVDLLTSYIEWSKTNSYYHPVLTIGYFLDECGQALGIERMFRDANSLDDDTLSQLQEYMLPGKMIVKLVPPREAKSEELP